MKRITLVLVALFAGLFVAGGLRTVLGWPRGGGLETKIQVYLDDADSIDAVYVGSSYTARGIDPRIVDARIQATLGRPFRSYNLAVDGALGYEIDYFLHAFFDRPAARLRYLVIEAPNFSGRIPEKIRGLNPRNLYWHDAHRTFHALLALARSHHPFDVRASDALLHLEMFGLRLTNAGAAEELWRAVSGARGPFQDYFARLSRRTRGYAPFEARAETEDAPSRQRFLRRPRDYLRSVDALAEGLPDLPREPFPASILEAQVAYLEARGIVPIYYVPPVLSPSEHFSALAERGTIAHLLDYSDPDRHAVLYELPNRWDATHLSEAGARIFSGMLARDLAQLLAAREAAP